jgi:hypothetical protein
MPKKLTLVTPAEPGSIQPPRPLGPVGREFWNTITAEYNIADAGGREILWQSCAALERAEELADSINRDGVVVQTRLGPREHPALKAELACRAFVVRSIHRLGLDIEPVRSTVGRPAGLY